ncbi:diacylglycerol/lipid kinase family protein [candidate division CSSED10-310 bacterium]|uniref:Diacylglycerol/lipid kinase family protein n=1 Tax=candidate division CSSED10-310 bacterium TaxID=2855610 RepID=A0ABV6Z1N1_UNCC1
MMVKSHDDSFFFIVNPAAGGGEVGQKWIEIEKRLRAQSVQYQVHQTTAPLEATEITRQALADGYKQFISVGGDGTNHEIINGLFDHQDTIPAGVSLGFFPSGSGNDFLRFINISDDLSQSMNRLHTAHTQKIDIGKMSFNRAGVKCHEYYLSVAGTGFTADVTKTANDYFKFLGGYCYIGGFLPNIAFLQNVALEITIDEETYHRKSCMTVVANTAYFGGGMKIAPDASIQDGLLDILLFREFGRLELIMNFLDVFKGTHVRHSKVEVFRGRHVTIKSEIKQNLLADGEIIGQTPVEFFCLPQVLSVRV